MFTASAAISALIAEVRSRGECCELAAIDNSTFIINSRCCKVIGHRSVNALAIMRVSSIVIKRSGRNRTALLTLDRCRVASYTLNAFWIWLR